MDLATFVEARLHTGRTHQIRVHFQYLGYPLAGDETYGQRQNTRLTERSGYIPPRLLLHAQTLAFVHPRSGRKRSFEAPLPGDFKQALAALRGKG
jgi:23S rRNA pseudouridine1911/1915/1917 synthase